MVETQQISFGTSGHNDIIDLTDKVREIVKKTTVSSGLVLLFVPGATGALSTIEYEDGLLNDFPAMMEKLIPEKASYRHNLTWHDGNGHSHLRATLVGPSLVIPVENREVILGTWQQIVFIEFDNKPHQRNIIVQLQGE